MPDSGGGGTWSRLMVHLTPQEDGVLRHFHASTNTHTLHTSGNHHCVTGSHHTPPDNTVFQGPPLHTENDHEFQGAKTLTDADPVPRGPSHPLQANTVFQDPSSTAGGRQKTRTTTLSRSTDTTPLLKFIPSLRLQVGGIFKRFQGFQDVQQVCSHAYTGHHHTKNHMLLVFTTLTTTPPQNRRLTR